MPAAYASKAMVEAGLQALHAIYGHSTLTPKSMQAALDAALHVMLHDCEREAASIERLGYPKTAEAMREHAREGWRRRIAELVQRIWPGKMPEFHQEEGYCELVVRHGQSVRSDYIEVQHARARTGLIGALYALAQPSLNELIARSSIGQAVKEMKEDPEGHLRRLEEELFKRRR